MDDPDFLADTLGLPRDLIWGLKFILQALSAGLPLDPHKFKAHCGIVKQQFYDLAPWVVMWASLHKVITI